MNRPVLIADDHPLFRGALKQAVAKVAANRPVIEASNLAEVRACLEEHEISLLLLDLHMSDSHGFSGLLAFRQAYPSVPVVVVSGSEEAPIIRRAVSFGASGFIPKSSTLDAMARALDQILMGEIWVPPHVDMDAEDPEDAASARLKGLTPAQLKVLMGVVRGLLNKQIAYEMDISEATVKAHMTAVFRKLGVINRTQAVLVAKNLDIEGDSVSP